MFKQIYRTIITKFRRKEQTVSSRNYSDYNGPTTFKTPYENFKSMRLKSRVYFVDTHGEWWKQEVRWCPSTGLILKMTERITGHP